MNFRLIILFLFIMLGCALQAQDEAKQFAYLTKEDGLLSDLTNCLFQDRDGFIWIGSESGLQRFDGINFKNFFHNAEDSLSLPSNSVDDVIQDDEGFLWIATGAGLSKFDLKTEKFKNYSREEFNHKSLPHNTVQTLFYDGGKVLWLGLYNKGLCRLDMETEEFKLYAIDHYLKSQLELGINSVNSITRDQNDQDKLWYTTPYYLYSLNITTEHIGIYEEIKESHSDRKRIFKDLICDKNGSIWVADEDGGLVNFNPVDTSWQWYRYPHVSANHTITSINFKSENEIWLASRLKGLGIFNKIDKSFHFYKYNLSQERTRGLEVKEILVDKVGSIWTGIFKGIARFDSRQNLFDNSTFRSLGISKRGEYGNVLDDTLNNQYIVSGSFIIDKKTKTISSGDKVKLSNGEIEKIGDVWDYEITPNGEIWCVANTTFEKEGLSGIFKLVPGKNYWIPVPFNGDKNYFIGKSFSRFLIDSKNQIWASSFFNGLYCFNFENDTIYNYKFDENSNNPVIPSGNFIYDLKEDNEGRIWYSPSNGLTRFNPKDSSYIKFNSNAANPNSISSNAVKGLAFDRNGYLWVGTKGGGLNRVDPRLGEDQDVLHFTVTSGLASDAVWELITDNDGIIWMATKNGFSAINPNNFEIRTFSKKDGLPNNWIRSLSRLSGTEMVASMPTNISLFDTREILKKLKPPDVVLTDLKIFNKKDTLSKGINYRDKLELKYNQNFISFDFAALSFPLAEQNLFAYKLEGLNEDWNMVGNRRFASYNSLREGDYTFRVKAANADGAWNEFGKSINISIQPPLWRTLWFRLLSGIMLIGLFYAFYKFRINQVRKEEQVKSEFLQKLAQVELKALRAQMNPHFLFNSLNAIKFYVLKRSKEKAVDYLNDFSKLVRMILNNSEMQLIPLSEEIEALRLYIQIERRRFNEEFDYVFKVSENVGLDKIKIPPLLLQPYVENAIWHGLMHKKDGAGRLLVSVEKQNGTLNCIIEDNGIGRKKAVEIKSKSATKRKSMGMQITKNRMEMNSALLKQEFEVEIVDLINSDETSSGTRVIISIKNKDNV